MIRHSCIIVKDLKKAEKFYINTFKLKLLKKDTLDKEYVSKLIGEKGIIKYVKLKDDKGSILELIESNVALPHIAFTVEDIEATYKTLKNKMTFISLPLKAPDSRVKVCYCIDPDGNEIELVQEL